MAWNGNLDAIHVDLKWESPWLSDCWNVYSNIAEMFTVILLKCLQWYCWNVYSNIAEMFIVILLKCLQWYCWNI